jgi:hypothetical protein
MNSALGAPTHLRSLMGIGTGPVEKFADKLKRRALLLSAADDWSMARLRPRRKNCGYSAATPASGSSCSSCAGKREGTWGSKA